MDATNKAVPDEFAGLRDAVGRLIKAKGRFHTEQNYAALVAAYDASLAATPSQPAAVSAPSGRECGACNGSGWMVRDEDIGTDQECFSCDGSGRVEDDAARAAAPSVSAPSDERAAFEAWMRKECGATDKCLIRRAEGHYQRGRTCDMYAAYELARAAAPSVSAPSDERPMQTRFLDEIDAGIVGEKWIHSLRTRDDKIEYVDDNGSRAPRVKWCALFDRFDKLTHCYLLTRDALNYTQLTMVDVAARAAAPVSGQGASICPLSENGRALPNADKFIDLMRDWRHAPVGKQADDAFKAVVQHIDSRPRSEDSRAKVLADAITALCPDGKVAPGNAVYMLGFRDAIAKSSALASTPPKADNE